MFLGRRKGGAHIHLADGIELSQNGSGFLLARQSSTACLNAASRRDAITGSSLPMDAEAKESVIDSWETV